MYGVAWMFDLYLCNIALLIYYMWSWLWKKCVYSLFICIIGCKTGDWMGGYDGFSYYWVSLMVHVKSILLSAVPDFQVILSFLLPTMFSIFPLMNKSFLYFSRFDRFEQPIKGPNHRHLQLMISWASPLPNMHQFLPVTSCSHHLYFYLCKKASDMN